MSENQDEKILDLAKNIQAERGGSLTDAMIMAEDQLSPRGEVPESFTVTIPVKARVASWILREFQPTKTHTTEERLAAYLQVVLNRARITAIRYAEEPPEIGEGSAVSMRREQFQKKAPEG